eukprot:357733-Pelagomonas_calceolata.AAC.6
MAILKQTRGDHPRCQLGFTRPVIAWIPSPCLPGVCPCPWTSACHVKENRELTSQLKACYVIYILPAGKIKLDFWTEACLAGYATRSTHHENAGTGACRHHDCC